MTKNLGVTKVYHSLADPLDRLQQALAKAPIQAMPALIGELEKLKAQAWSKLPGPSLGNSSQSILAPDQDSDMGYLSIHDLAARIGYAEGTIRNLMTEGVFKLGEHYVKPRGRIFFKWPAVRSWLEAKGTQG